jgi:hypothetical protein
MGSTEVGLLGSESVGGNVTASTKGSIGRGKWGGLASGRVSEVISEGGSIRGVSLAGFSLELMIPLGENFASSSAVGYSRDAGLGASSGNASSSASVKGKMWVWVLSTGVGMVDAKNRKTVLAASEIKQASSERKYVSSKSSGSGQLSQLPDQIVESSSSSSSSS